MKDFGFHIDNLISSIIDHNCIILLQSILQKRSSENQLQSRPLPNMNALTIKIWLSVYRLIQKDLSMKNWYQLYVIYNRVYIYSWVHITSNEVFSMILGLLICTFFKPKNISGPANLQFVTWILPDKL